MINRALGVVRVTVTKHMQLLYDRRGHGGADPDQALVAAPRLDIFGDADDFAAQVPLGGGGRSGGLA